MTRGIQQLNKYKKQSLILVIFTALTLLFSTTATAAEQEETLTVVSLGDSITFGWNLEQPQTPPVQSENAFPFLIGNGNAEVLNVSYPGWTSTQLLEAIKTEESQQKLQQAETVTLSIGANDLLQAFELSKMIENQQAVLSLSTVTAEAEILGSFDREVGFPAVFPDGVVARPTVAVTVGHIRRVLLARIHLGHGPAPHLLPQHIGNLRPADVEGREHLSRPSGFCPLPSDF